MTNAAVWKFFGKNNEEIQCKLCEQVYPRPKDGSTSNLLYHLEHAHNIDRSKLASFSGTQQPLVLAQRPSRAATTQVVMEWLVRDLRPMSTVNSAAFRALCALFGAEVPHSRNLTRTYLPRLYEACKVHIINTISASKATVSYTTDAWTDKHNTRSYMTLSANVVLDWKLTTFCLATRHMKEAHTADNLVVWLKAVMRDFKVDVGAKDACLGATTDNASNMKAAIAQIGHFHMPCIAHTLNLIVKEALAQDVVADFMQRMRRMVKYFHKSPIAAAVLEDAANAHEVTIRQRCAEVYPEGNPKRMKLPTRLKKMVDTRWLSAQETLTRIYQLFPAILTSVQKLCSKPGHTVPDEVQALSLSDETTIKSIRTALTDVMQAMKEVQEQRLPALGPALLSLFFVYGALSQKAHTARGLEKRICTYIRNAMAERFWSTASAFRTAQSVSDLVLGPSRWRHSISSALDVALVAAAIDPRCRTALLTELKANTAFALPDVPGSAHADRAKAYITVLLQHAAIDSTPAEEQQVGVIEEEQLAEGVAPDRATWWRKKVKREGLVPTVVDQINAYLVAPLSDQQVDIGTDPLEFWREHATRWPHLSNIAARFLVIMPSSAEAERTFSTSGDVLTPLRSNLKPDHVDKLVFLAKNLRAGRIPPDVTASAFAVSG